MPNWVVSTISPRTHVIIWASLLDGFGQEDGNKIEDRDILCRAVHFAFMLEAVDDGGIDQAPVGIIVERCRHRNISDLQPRLWGRLRRRRPSVC